jgi:phosphorylase kinase alpha/beta subunit
MNGNEKITAKDELEPLRTEIRESEKARIELLRYKLMAVAVLGAIGLGFQIQRDNKAILDFDYVLCIIPFVCTYIDLLCYHNTIRILVIAHFLNHNDDPYEGYISQLNNSYNKGVRYFFNMEELALIWSSIAVSFLISIYSFIPFLEEKIIEGSIFFYVGIIAIIISCLTKEYSDRHQKALSSTADKLRAMSIINNKFIKKTLKNSYLKPEIKELLSLFYNKDTFSFEPLKNGLFQAANLQIEFEYTGYNNVWVRDNIHIAHAHYINDHTEIAIKNVTAFSDYFIKYQWRFEKILSGELDFNDPTNRPHIRFNGDDLSEIDEKWSHAQNDALGYFLWLFCKLHNVQKSHDGGFICNLFAHFQKLRVNKLTSEQSQLLALFALYFEKIEYWHDEDNGHWEEARKIEASSIGVVVAALTELKELLKTYTVEYQDKKITADFLNALIGKGRQSLKQILPAECIQVNKYRSCDAALLFLIYPLDIIQDENLEKQILNNVIKKLKGDYGIRRYIGDSYWSADYKDKVKPEQRTIDVSDDMSSRDSLLQIGQEAQWCIFDPIISVIYGKKYQKTKKSEDLQLQTEYFNRSLAQLTPDFKCPELYYLEKGQYVPNDTTPLLWTQANLWIAFKFMEQNCK